MSLLDTLSLREKAEQLRSPSGELGLAVADLLSPINRDGNMGAVARLGLERGDRVLEVGCGLGDMASVVTAAAEDVRYVGLDPSGTMVDAARDRNRGLIQVNSAEFHLGRSERMPFEAACFSKVFSVGVAHFWEDPIGDLSETARVMSPGARMVMACLGPERAPAFAQKQHGFHLRDADFWHDCCRKIGFREVEIETSTLDGAGGAQVFRISARRAFGLQASAVGSGRVDEASDRKRTEPG